MKKLVEGFVHKPGVHCESSAIRDVLAYFGLPLTEEMVFGLDCTFGFVYQTKFSEFPPFHIGGKITTFPNTLPRFLNIEVEKKTTLDRHKAWLEVKKLIDENVPVLLFVDIYFIDYLKVPKEPWNHFGAHMVVLAGYDEEEKVAYLADTSFEGLQKVSLQSLEKARASEYESFPPENAWFELKIKGKPKLSDETIRRAIKTTAKEMIYPKDKNFGVRGMEKLLEDMLEWPKVLPQQDFRKALLLAYVDLEEAGTGGGNFRKLYSRFLKEAGEKLQDEDLEEASKGISFSANLWTDTANCFLKASRSKEFESFLDQARDNIARCLEIEREVFSSFVSL